MDEKLMRQDRCAYLLPLVEPSSLLDHRSAVVRLYPQSALMHSVQL